MTTPLCRADVLVLPVVSGQIIYIWNQNALIAGWFQYPGFVEPDGISMPALGQCLVTFSIEDRCKACSKNVK